MASGVAVLEHEMYSEAEAARLLGVSQATLNYWLEGKIYRRVTYQPILRDQPTGGRTVTWAEFVEAGLLRQYRRDWNVAMSELRAFIGILRDQLGVPYPLATERPWSASGRLIIKAQETSGLPREFWLCAPADGQLLLLPPAQSFLDRVTFDGGHAVSWRPHNDPASPVVIDPDQRSGRPSISGISTSVLAEYADSGFDNQEIAATFGLSGVDVAWGLAYENSTRAA